MSRGSPPLLSPFLSCILCPATCVSFSPLSVSQCKILSLTNVFSEDRSSFFFFLGWEKGSCLLHRKNGTSLCFHHEPELRWVTECSGIYVRPRKWGSCSLNLTPSEIRLTLWTTNIFYSTEYWYFSSGDCCCCSQISIFPGFCYLKKFSSLSWLGNKARRKSHVAKVVTTKLY